MTLALDASTRTGTLALIRGGIVIAEREALMRGELDERLMPALLAMLAEAGYRLTEIGRVACGAGPGSFTSLRIAAAIAKGIAVGNAAGGSATRVFAVSSLALIVGGTRPPVGEGRYLALLDAMRGERYAGLFAAAADGTVRAVSGLAETRIPAAEVAAVCERLGATAIGPGEKLDAAPHARGVARLLDDIATAGPVSLDSWEPAYGRLAEAQVQWEAAQGKVLPASRK